VPKKVFFVGKASISYLATTLVSFLISPDDTLCGSSSIKILFANLTISVSRIYSRSFRILLRISLKLHRTLVRQNDNGCYQVSSTASNRIISGVSNASSDDPAKIAHPRDEMAAVCSICVSRKKPGFRSAPATSEYRICAEVCPILAYPRLIYRNLFGYLRCHFDENGLIFLIDFLLKF
jgi:hypothetical protein